MAPCSSVGRTIVGDAVADVGDVAHAGGGATLLPCSWHPPGSGARPRAVLRHVADAAGRATLRAAGDERIRRAVVVHTVAELGDVADARRAAALRRRLRVRRTIVTDAVTGLRDVAHAARGAAHGAALRIGRTVVVHAVAHLGGIAGARRRAALRRALRVAGQLLLTPLQNSAGSHTPADPRQRAVLLPSAGQLALDPVQVSAASQTPAARTTDQAGAAELAGGGAARVDEPLLPPRSHCSVGLSVTPSPQSE